jgi:hypothetical protein
MRRRRCVRLALEHASAAFHTWSATRTDPLRKDANTPNRLPFDQIHLEALQINHLGSPTSHKSRDLDLGSTLCTTIIIDDTGNNYILTSTEPTTT